MVNELEWSTQSNASIFCGDVHFAHADAIGKGACQYVTQPASRAATA
ncbi:hypothetical protein JOC55_006177 [Paenibacillus sacheonensis]|nr:hypothetical protein [Paenibacillus sacheonensis]